MGLGVVGGISSPFSCYPPRQTPSRVWLLFLRFRVSGVPSTPCPCCPPLPPPFGAFQRSSWPTACAPSASGFRVQGSGSRVQGSGSRVRGSGLKVQGSGFRDGGATSNEAGYDRGDGNAPRWAAHQRARASPGAPLTLTRLAAPACGV